MSATTCYAELVSEIETFPSIDALRLRLADYLGRQSSPRGRLISEQCSSNPDPECIKQLLDKHGRSLAAQDLGIPDRVIPSGATFEFYKGFAWWPLKVEYPNFQAAIDAGQYDSVNPNITAAGLGLEDAPIAIKAKLVLYAPNPPITSSRTIWEIHRQLGLHIDHDQFWELCAFGATYPEVQRAFPVVCLGSSWVDSDGYRDVPYLGYCNAGRDLDLDWFVGGWDRDCRFAAVRQQPLNPGNLSS